MLHPGSRPPQSPAGAAAPAEGASARPVLRRPNLSAKPAPAANGPSPGLRTGLPQARDLLQRDPERAIGPGHRPVHGLPMPAGGLRQCSSSGPGSTLCPPGPPLPGARPASVGGITGSRLGKRMAELGLCSRREASMTGLPRLGQSQWHEVAPMGLQVTATDRMSGNPGFPGQRVAILLNKPIGYVSGQAEDGHTRRGADQSRTHWRGDPSRNRFSAAVAGPGACGRLDIDSVGLVGADPGRGVARQIIGEDP